MANSAASTRLPSLDGWRAICIVMVLGDHTEAVVFNYKHYRPAVFNWLFDGNLGVRFFFSISGFLITWLLLREIKKSGGINLKDFYMRRFLRILPVYYAFVLALVGLQMFTPFRETMGGWVGMLTFTRNYTDGSGASVHFWSLSVEEQFYLVWPSLLIFLASRTRRASYVLLAVPIIAAPVFRLGEYVFFHHHEHALRGLNGIHFGPPFLKMIFFKFSFFCNFDSLAFGCLFAILFANEKRLIENILRKRRGTVWVTGLLLVLVPHVLGNLSLPWPMVCGLLLKAFGDSFQALGFSMLLVQSLVEPAWWGYRILNWRWVGWIGLLSYSIYIWQQIFCSQAWRGAWEKPADSFWAWFWLAPAFAAAIISYYGLERPLLRVRSRFRHA